MDATLKADRMTDEQNGRLADVIARENGRLRSFIRNRVPDQSDAEDILQEVFGELIEAYRLMKPIEQVGAWLFRVARNRITDLFRRKRPGTMSQTAVENGEDSPLLEELLPSPDDGPEALYARGILLDELEAALEELPEEQRDVFIAHELEGVSFKELAARTQIPINTLLSRKHYAVLHLRKRLRSIYEELTT
jgi:RNA polymerase sigma factor (sigma-70 family)